MTVKVHKNIYRPEHLLSLLLYLEKHGFNDGYGGNDHLLDLSKHTILSATSCTTNCIAPLLNILDQSFQVKRGWMTTDYAYTSDQKHIDNPLKDLRRARACTQSIVPTTKELVKPLLMFFQILLLVLKEYRFVFLPKMSLWLISLFK
jgi:Glyceraldehyde 3-phosphate dehydrogenase, C-terminal domain